MKKMMLGLTAAFCAAVSFADGVESANIVGYTTKDAPQAIFRLAGVPFEGTDGSLNVNDILPYSTTIEADDAGAFMATAPQIQIQKADGGYTTYYFVNNALYLDADGEAATKPGWVDMFGVLATPELFAEELVAGDGNVTPGAAIWFKDPTAPGKLLAAGAVIAEDIEIDCPAGFRLRANAFPMDLQINDVTQVTFSGMADVAADEAGAFIATAPQIQIQKADGGYNTYYYVNNALYLDDAGEPAEKAGWVDMFGVLATPELFAEELVAGDGVAKVAHGMWTKGVSQSFMMTFKAPIK